MVKEIPNVTFEDARILFRNFAGGPSKYKPGGGVRDFALVLPEESVDGMVADGWNVKYLKAREDVEDSEPLPYLKVEVKYAPFPPRIVLISSRGKTALTEDTVNVLDFAEIETLDIVIRPYSWEVNGNSGVKAFVKSLYVTIVEDDLERKYADVNDTATEED